MSTPHYGQPGLEVVQQDYYSMPQVVEEGHPKYGYPYGVLPAVAQQYAAAPPSDPPSGKGVGSPNRKKMWWIIGGIVLLLVIIGAVVGGLYGGGVIGSSKSVADGNGDRGNEDSSTDEPTTTGSASPTTTTTDPAETSTVTAFGVPQSIRPGSPLAVAGWERPGGSTEIYLFHQDDEYNIRYSRFDDGEDTRALNDTYWNEPVKINSYAEENSRLSATLLIYGEVHQPQVELFYSGSKTRLLGANVNLRSNPTSADDSINEKRLESYEGGSVSSYWPWMTYQNSEGELMEVRNLLGPSFNPQSAWDVRELGIRTLRGSRVALVPMSTVFTKMAIGGGFGIIYRDMDGYLAVAVPRLDQDEVAEDYVRSWPDHSEFPSIAVEMDAPIAAFSAARLSDTSGRVDTYILYLNGTDIHMINNVGSRSWTETQPEALRGVDPDTDITCITLGSSNAGPDGKAFQIYEAGGSARCYFQRDGVVQEAVLDGSEWKKTQIIPIP